MPIPRQAPFPEEPVETGRVNQKRRTRAAIVEAAKQLVSAGATPTVAEAAEAALVSRTTAYRYFPTQEALLIELSVDLDVDDLEALASSPLGSDEDPASRALTVVDELNRHVFAEETRYKQLLRTYLDLGLAAKARGDDDPVVRVGRRVRWYADTLAPLRAEVGDDAVDRLVAALSLLAGTEAMVVLRDVCRLEPENAQAVTEWAARVLVAATVAGDTTEGGNR
jgi:AcrR family transcriptional regulator